MWGTVAKAPDRGSPGFQYKPLRAAARREALPVRRNTLFGGGAPRNAPRKEDLAVGTAKDHVASQGHADSAARLRNVKLRPLVTCALLLTVAAGCTSGHLSQPAPLPSTGHVRGQLLFVGGPAPGSARPLSGTVTLSGHVQMNVTVGLRGHYFATLPPGVYRVEGRSPQFGSGTYPCHAQARVTVGPNETAQADVYCQGK
jgi:hypothetical protein